LHDTGKTTTSRSWPLVPISADITPQLWVVHNETIKNVGTPEETTDHEWTLEARFPRLGRETERQRIELGKAPDSASFDQVLNTVRVAMVEARSGLAEM
jgi:hypothetical protein